VTPDAAWGESFAASGAVIGKGSPVYKLLLCWRYLRTRYLALACVISVMLGVATLIVVNSVMGGFSTKLKERLHGLLSDVLIEAASMEGFDDPAGKMQRIRASAIGPKIEAMTPTIEVFAMMQYYFRNELVTRPVRLIGIDPEGRARIGGFAEHLVLQKNSPHPSFELSAEAKLRCRQNQRFLQLARAMQEEPPSLGQPPPPDPPPSEPKLPVGIIVGNALVHFRNARVPAGERPQEIRLLNPGDDVIVTTVSGQRLAPVFDRFVICDYFRSEMSEYDSNYVFVPLDHLQKLRTMEDRVTSIQIKLKDYGDAREVVRALEDMFLAERRQGRLMVQTWEDKQGPLLAAISIEKGILNVLLFMIIAVAGFGILSIFAMIVVEKTRDIGILKALGASNGGVMAIFLGYGLLLGLVGSACGTGLGLLITTHINQIEQWLTRATGQEIFDRTVYYFSEIPTDIQAHNVLLINLGALAIAVVFSILPALRAALLHPVRALRYE
jgi:lipoprotein-releasing system permease protein